MTEEIISSGSKGYLEEERLYEERLKIFRKQLDFIYEDLLDWAAFKRNNVSEPTNYEQRWTHNQQRRIVDAFTDFRNKLYEIEDKQMDHRQLYVRFDEATVQEVER